MKMKNIFRLIFISAIFASGVCFIQAADMSSVQWNAMAQSQILNNTELAKLDDVFPGWQIKQVVWPTDSEINLKRVAVDQKVTASCMKWLMKFIKKEQLPAGLEAQLVPMKGWGVIGEKSSTQGHFCDVFITRFKKGDSVVQIQESPYDVVIAFSNEKLKDSPAVNHKDLVVEVANLLLNSNLKPRVDSKNLYISEFVDKGQKITRVLWSIESVNYIDKQGKKRLDLHKAGEIGTTSVEAETDGRFVRFAIRKEIDGPGINPYASRFTTSIK